jgi:hypothetical protein
VFGKKEKEEDSRYDRRGKPFEKQSEEDTNRSSQEDDDNKLKGLEELLNRASNVDPNISMLKVALSTITLTPPNIKSMMYFM